MARQKIFISYSHKDKRLLAQVREHLKVLEVLDLVDIFDDEQLVAGENWHQRLHEEMLKARIGLLLISATFITSAFIRNEEVPTLFGKHEKDGMIIYPLLIRDCAWKEVKWLKEKHMRPKTKRSVFSFRGPRRDTVLKEVTEEIAGIVKNPQGQL